VKFYGMDSHAQAPGDLSIRHTFCHQLHNLLLTRRERAQWAGSVVHTMTVKGQRWSIYRPNEQKPLRGLASWLGRCGCGIRAPDSPPLGQAGLGIAGTPPVGSPSSVAMWKAGAPRDPVVGRRRRRWRGCRLEGLANRSGALE
jgi:hypothetical protein